MISKPILFSAPMVRSLLNGTKAQTRRGLSNVMGVGAVTEFQLSDTNGYDWIMRDSRMLWNDFRTADLVARAPHPVGSEMWVRESYFQRGHWEPVSGAKERTRTGRQRWVFVPADGVIVFEVPAEYRKGRHSKDPGTIAWHKRLARFMPRWASRITLTVTDVRVQRLQDISEEDAKAEGSPDLHPIGSARGWYASLWDTINGPGSWAANPFVWKYTFERTA